MTPNSNPFLLGAQAGAASSTGQPYNQSKIKPTKQSQTREAARAYSDLREFPRATLATAYARKCGLPPWERETLTYSERRGGSIFGFGLVDNPLDTSPGKRRVFQAAVRNGVRAKVRILIDGGKTDEEIRSELQRGDLIPATVNAAGAILSGLGFGSGFDPIPTDIRRRFGV